jgi:ribosomal protein S18 acetylase RimI-like enzyme
MRPEAAISSRVRSLRPEDRPQIEALLRAASNFTAEEITTALEVIDDALAGDPDYLAQVLQNEAGHILGYECHGPVPLTLGTYDLYWIAVDPRVHNSGYGRALLRAAEKDVAARGGRLMLIETSSQASYDSTVRFYERNAYHLEARIHDFYRPGDDKLIFAKNIEPDIVRT